MKTGHFNSQPHKEADDLALSFAATYTEYFNSQPHKEADLVIIRLAFAAIYFNSQPHKEADLRCSYVCKVFFLFQLTASQGG